MKNTGDNILIVGGSSDISRALIVLLIKNGFNVFATYRSNLPSPKDGFTPLTLDVTKASSFEALGKEINNLAFNSVIYTPGIAVASSLCTLPEEDLNAQLDVSVMGLARFLKFIHPYLTENSKVITISSMASFGIFPYISPYCASKAAGDILLNSFEIETGIPCVSIKPGVVGTKFWEYCVNLNRKNFENLSGERRMVGEFLLSNALKNKTKGVSPNDVAKVILKAISSKNPKASYLVGFDSKIASLSKFVPKKLLNKIIRYTLNYKIRKYINGK